MGSAKAVKPAMSPQLVVLTLALLLGAQPVTTDLYLPALPRLMPHVAAAS
ncbi:MAG: hypothetical protein JWP52_2384 [Rhizobacter sp.]|nr:hypothetical protein [Rhizobacter sp.]